jgi:hypothetical protein
LCRENKRVLKSQICVTRPQCVKWLAMKHNRMSLIVKNHHYLIHNPKLYLNFNSTTQSMIILQMVVAIYYKINLIFFKLHDNVSQNTEIFTVTNIITSNIKTNVIIMRLNASSFCFLPVRYRSSSQKSNVTKLNIFIYLIKAPNFVSIQNKGRKECCVNIFPYTFLIAHEEQGMACRCRRRYAY